MSTSPAQYLPGLGPCARVDPVAAGSNSSDASYTRTITIVFGIIGAVLTLFTLVIATLQYRLQMQRRTDVERVEDDTEMSSQCSIEPGWRGARLTVGKSKPLLCMRTLSLKLNHAYRNPLCLPLTIQVHNLMNHLLCLRGCMHPNVPVSTTLVLSLDV
jgi:hypothetical protein